MNVENTEVLVNFSEERRRRIKFSLGNAEIFSICCSFSNRKSNP